MASLTLAEEFDITSAQALVLPERGGTSADEVWQELLMMILISCGVALGSRGTDIQGYSWMIGPVLYGPYLAAAIPKPWTRRRRLRRAKELRCGLLLWGGQLICMVSADGFSWEVAKRPLSAFNSAQVVDRSVKILGKGHASSWLLPCPSDDYAVALAIRLAAALPQTVAHSAMT